MLGEIAQQLCVAAHGRERVLDLVRHHRRQLAREREPLEVTPLRLHRLHAAPRLFQLTLEQRALGGDQRLDAPRDRLAHHQEADAEQQRGHHARENAGQIEPGVELLCRRRQHRDQPEEKARAR